MTDFSHQVEILFHRVIPQADSIAPKYLICGSSNSLSLGLYMVGRVTDYNDKHYAE